MFGTVLDLLARVVQDVVGTLVADWPYLLASVVAAAVLTVYVGTDRLAGWLRRRRWAAITGAVLLATLTPFCSCGTTAVVLGMVATAAPWAPIVAFMVASPLTSPSELLLSAGLFGWGFALLYFVSATALGFAAGGVTAVIEGRGWLAHQARMSAEARVCPTSCASPAAADPTPSPGRVRTRPRTRSRAAAGLPARLRLWAFTVEFVRLGRRIGLYFLAYSALGYLIIEALPSDGLVGLLGSNPGWGVPLAAILGIPIYLTSEASLPMVAALMDGGLGAGPAMAFLITGAGTSLGAITGMLLIAGRRVVGLVVAILLAGGFLVGWAAALAL